MLKAVKILSLVLVLMFVASFSAKASDDANVCLQETIKAEKKYNIREYLLSTIAVVESGRWSDATKDYVAWPWTINVNGQGMFFATKKEAIDKTKKLLASGHDSIDVGCMQINLKYHGNEFASLDDAFTPSVNVAYAAKFLTSLYNETGEWLTAATSYHSKIKHKADKYENKVVSVFSRIYQDAQKGKPLVSKEKAVAFNSYVEKSKEEYKPFFTIEETRAKAFAVQWREAKIAEYLKKKALKDKTANDNG